MIRLLTWLSRVGKLTAKVNKPSRAGHVEAKASLKCLEFPTPGNEQRRNQGHYRYLHHFYIDVSNPSRSLFACFVEPNRNESLRQAPGSTGSVIDEYA